MNPHQVAAERYKTLITEINRRVMELNVFLSTRYRLRKIDPRDPETFVAVENSTLLSRSLPNNCDAGVFVIGAHDMDNPTRLAALVGRSSLKTMRFNIRSLLEAYEATDYRTIKSGSSRFCLDVLLRVSTSVVTRSMACALYEHIIKHDLDSVCLLNGPETLSKQ